jgi:hypothetical protein
VLQPLSGAATYRSRLWTTGDQDVRVEPLMTKEGFSSFTGDITAAKTLESLRSSSARSRGPARG